MISNLTRTLPEMMEHIENDKKSTTYFMTKMTQKEWDELRKGKPLVVHKFNKIRNSEILDNLLP